MLHREARFLMTQAYGNTQANVHTRVMRDSNIAYSAVTLEFAIKIKRPNWAFYFYGGVCFIANHNIQIPILQGIYRDYLEIIWEKY